MSFAFTTDHIRHIGAVLGVEAGLDSDHYRYEIRSGDPTRQVTLEVYPSIAIGTEQGALVSVFTPNANLQLQHCSGFVVSEMLGEVTFFAEADGKVSGLIIEREGGCSLYANVDRSLLSGDFTALGPEVMMSGIALSLTEFTLSEDEAPDGTEDLDA